MRQDLIEKASWKYNPLKKLDGEFIRAAFVEGAKWMSDRTYAEEEINPLLSFIKEIRDNWDCDSDGHKYNTGCRCCEAKQILEQFKKI